MSKRRPIGVMLLAVLAALAGIAATIHTLQMLHLWPIKTTYFGREVNFFDFNLIGAALWGMLAAIYFWLVWSLWKVDARAWLFLVVLASLNLILAVLSIIGQSTWQAMLPTLIVNGLILFYCLLPGTKEAFEITPT
jgi:hypothetical protein